MKINHTELRGKTYWFVLRVPSHLQAAFKLTRIRESLRTQDPKVAKHRASERFLHWSDAFHQVELRQAQAAQPQASNQPLSEADAAYVQQWAEAHYLATDEKKRISGELLTPESIQFVPASRANITKILKTAIGTGQTAPVRGAMEYAIRQRGITGTPSPEQVYAFAKMMKKATEAVLARDDGEVVETPPMPTSISVHPSLSVIIDAYYREQELGGTWSDKTMQENKAIYSLVLRILGDVDVSKLSFPDVRRVKETLLKLPANLNRGRFKGLSIDAIIKLQPEPMGIGTVNKYLIRLSSLFEWMVKQGYVDKNYADNMTVQQRKKAAEQRDMFTSQQLCAMFAAIQHGLVVKRGDRKPFHYWMPLLGYFTGARVNELASLRPQDVVQEDGIHCLSITQQNDGEKGTKTIAGARLIAIHPKLIELGFIDYAKQQASAGHNRLFPELPMSATNGYGARVSKWFSGQAGRESGFLYRAGIDAQVSFHSFRHTFITMLEQADISPILVKRLAGHSFTDVTYERYSKGSTAKQGREALVKAIPVDVVSGLVRFADWL
ncbi:site-specific integrase [Paludibacterium sp. B53371]|uniref:site-specific integrase n=1 Tax=Paludibacterium sp. B53371 TaxID=2806263 RepID=UPI001C04A5A4|nr:site-specific integrase [Paludibacterium sp. B53371]